MRTSRYSLPLAIVTLSTMAFAQDPDNWRRFDPPQQSASQAPDPNLNPNYPQPAETAGGPYAQAPPADQQYPAPPPPPAGNYPQNQPGYNQPGYNQGPPPPPPSGAYSSGGYPHFPDEYNSGQYPGYNQGPAPAEATPPPPVLSVPADKYITVRTNTFLSSNRNQAGDFFTATLVEPLVIDGYVVARRGQIINGRVVDVQKAGRVKGVSKLQVELVELNAVDGQQIPIHTQLVERRGPTSVGRDVGAVAGTTALGAAVGAAADWGRGAAIGAGAGAALGIIGVLVTRGEPTIVPPETLLTFRVTQGVNVSTVRSPYSFAQVTPMDYNQSGLHARNGMYGPGYGAGYPPPPPPAYYGYPYAPYYGGVGLWVGPRYYRGGFYYRRW